MKITNDFVLFWGSYFSNWYLREFDVDSITFNCAEQYFMYKKALYFNDTNIANKILNKKNPRDQKELGRKVLNFDKYTWDNVCYDIMKTGVKEKFSQNYDLKIKLINTGNRIIAEASPKDIIWGIGLDENNINALNMKNWKGQNLLGKILMDVREIIK